MHTALASGFQAGAVADHSKDKVGAAHEKRSKKISRMRSQYRKGEEVSDEFTDEERKEMTQGQGSV